MSCIFLGLEKCLRNFNLPYIYIVQSLEDGPAVTQLIKERERDWDLGMFFPYIQ